MPIICKSCGTKFWGVTIKPNKCPACKELWGEDPKNFPPVVRIPVQRTAGKQPVYNPEKLGFDW